jgi:Glycosyltransferases involved in cell wall biogenesis
MIDKYIISVIIPTYQAEDSIRRAIQSVVSSTYYEGIEIVVVDDCSDDTTCDIVKNMQEEYGNIKLYSMKENSGGPSAPRNLGIEKAQGKYITFLDDDDEINSNNLLKMVNETQQEDADFSKGYLICLEGKERKISNRLPYKPDTTEETIRNMIINQSMTQDFIVRREVLMSNNLRYREDLKIGEDTVFVSGIFSKIKKAIYIDSYFLTYYKIPIDISNLSSTQNWGDKEITQQIISWKMAQEILKNININYYKLRLPAAFRNLLISVVRFSNGLTKETYNMLSDFANDTKLYVGQSMNLSSRYKELYNAILSRDYEEYCYQSKRRLLIAGYDLKFILPVVKYLEDEFNIEVDEWSGHDMHDINKSNKMIQWADIIWCEWMLGNAVFYSENKNKNQRLIIRAHRFEITRSFGNKINWERVDMVFTVGYYYYEQFISKFSIPRDKMRLLCNYVEQDIYSTEKISEARFNIGMVGILPKRKGFLRGIKILEKVLEKDDRFRLYIMGKSYTEVPWIKNNPSEKEYFDECENYINKHDLSKYIIYGGYVERENLYKNLGYVLSLSDNEQPESFHLSPAEAACSGSMGMLLNWPGVEYIYPKDVIYENINEIADEILKAYNDEEYYKSRADYFKEFVMENYNIYKFIDELKQYLVKVRIVG